MIYSQYYICDFFEKFFVQLFCNKKDLTRSRSGEVLTMNIRRVLSYDLESTWRIRDFVGFSNLELRAEDESRLIGELVEAIDRLIKDLDLGSLRDLADDV